MGLVRPTCLKQTSDLSWAGLLLLWRMGVGRTFSKRWPIVMKFHFTNSKLRGKRFFSSSKTLTGKYQILKSRGPWCRFPPPTHMWMGLYELVRYELGLFWTGLLWTFFFYERVLYFEWPVKNRCILNGHRKKTRKKWIGKKSTRQQKQRYEMASKWLLSQKICPGSLSNAITICGKNNKTGACSNNSTTV